MSSTDNQNEESSFFLDATHEDYAEGLYMSPQDFESFRQRLQTAQPLLPNPLAKGPEQSSPSSPAAPQEFDPHEDLRKYIPNNLDIDLSLPTKQIIRIMKKAVPPDALISETAKGDMGRCVVEFIQFITSEAAEIAIRTHRSTIEGGDIIEAMDKTGFENYAEALRPYLEAYREEKRKSGTEKKNKGKTPASKTVDEPATSSAASPGEDDT